MPPSYQYEDPRPTLPHIRDLFREELSKRPNPYDSPSIALARLHVSEDEDKYYPHEDSLSKSLYQLPLRHSDPTLGPAQQLRTYREQLPRIQHFDTERSMSSNRANSSFQAAHPAAPSPISHPTGFSDSAKRNESFHHLPPPRHRHTVPQPYEYRNPSGYSSNTLTRHRSETALSEPSPRPQKISTSVSNMTEDDERTPVARISAHGSLNISHPVPRQPLDDSASSSSKYECSYCGKGFNRPSSLKIHLNSHTGEKRKSYHRFFALRRFLLFLQAFVCPVETCGRSFSVLSNMRRHTRVHATPGDSGNDEILPSTISRSESFSRMFHHRRGSTASTSSSNSRRSHSVSSTDDEIETRFRPRVT
ncbi:hypothetical protein GALMADRAFT_249226 [Galerina marginata CBS 339.88]|uniref:C2H2-type domain-containing protein n=1 Tax=Galerina marginata (strain CBS 339.88) TaxID=685588 RepID=A0A067T5M9_GALM3|nr:hypothetical protein GALMADRAFT_249226 [Galerina marginata CBS 339.88]